MPEIGTGDGGAAQWGGTGLDIILGAVESSLGVQYKWGGNSLASGVDCSGLLQQAFRAAGYNIPRVSNQQAQAGRAVDFTDMQVGDLLWYDNSSRNNGADHIAIYVGNGMMIEAYRTGTAIRATPVRKPTGVTRIIGSVPRSAPQQVKLGPNQDRTYTKAALTAGPAAGVINVGGAIGAVGGNLNPVADGGDPSQRPGGTGGTGGIVGGKVTLGPDGQLVATPGTGRTITADSSPEEIDAYIRENYPQLAGLMDVPEIKQLLLDAAAGDWDQHELAAKLGQSNWWKNTPPKTRQWLALVGADPAAAEKAIKDQEGWIRTKWQAYGGYAGPRANEMIRKLASDAMVQGINPEELEQRIVSVIQKGDPGAVRDLAAGDARDAQILASGDREQIKARVKAIFNNAGVLIGTSKESDDARLDRITDEVLAGRSFDNVRTAVDRQRPTGGLQPGTITATADQLGAMAREFLVPVAQKDLEDWAFRIASGTASQDGFGSWLKQLSKGRFASDPTVTAFIEGGGTPGQYFASHRQIVAGLLEMSPDQIDLMDPKWMELTEQVGKDGTRRAPTLAEAALWARKHEDFQYTRMANDQGARYAETILRTFGAK